MRSWSTFGPTQTTAPKNYHAVAWNGWSLCMPYYVPERLRGTEATMKSRYSHAKFCIRCQVKLDKMDL